MKRSRIFTAFAAVALFCCTSVLRASPPNVSVQVDGHGYGSIVYRPPGSSASVTVRFIAQDPDGNLDGIRYNVWNPASGYFDNGGGGFIGSGEVVRTVNLNTDGEWYFWTDAQDYDGEYASTGAWTSGFKIELRTNNPPSATISVDGYSPGASVARPPGGSASVNVRFGASDPDGNLRGIRYNVWHPASGRFDNGGAFQQASGGSSVYQRGVSLDADGEWYFWTDVEDTAGAYASTGDWGSGFRLVVGTQNTPPQSHWVTAGDTISDNPTTFQGRGTDQDGNLSYLLFFASGPNFGLSYVGTGFANNGNDSTVATSWSPPGSGGNGTWMAHVRAVDATGEWDSTPNNVSYFRVRTTAQISSQNAACKVGQSFAPLYSGPSGGTWQFVIAGHTNWGGTSPGTLLPPNNIPSTTWTPTQPGTYSFWIRRLQDDSYLATDGVGPYTLSVTQDDTQAPSVPMGLYGSGVTQTSFTLNWSASSDNVGVSSYEVYRSGSYIGATASTSFQVSALSPASTYTMTVRARDAAGNWSGFSSPANVVTAAPIQVPVITSATAASASIGTPFAYQITATNTPTSFGASSLPAGLTINSSSGLISGTPSQAGSFAVTIYASNLGGTASAGLTITIQSPPSGDLKIHRPEQ